MLLDSQDKVNELKFERRKEWLHGQTFDNNLTKEEKAEMHRDMRRDFVMPRPLKASPTSPSSSIDISNHLSKASADAIKNSIEALNKPCSTKQTPLIITTPASPPLPSDAKPLGIINLCVPTTTSHKLSGRPRVKIESTR